MDHEKENEQKRLRLAALIEEQKDEIIARWSRRVHQVLGLNANEQPQLIDHLPDLLDELSTQLAEQIEEPVIRSSRMHGQHRKQAGFDIKGLVCEFGIIQEVIHTLAEEESLTPTWQEVQYLSKAMSNATADSVDEYAKLKDQELADQASEHFAFVAHEIRNPLQTANMAWQLLSTKLEGDEDPAAQRLQRSLRQLRALVDNSLVDISLTGMVRPRFTRLQVAHIVEEAWSDVELNAEKKSVSIELDVDESLDVDGDERLLHSIMTNLLSNALKFTMDGGVITVSAHAAEGGRVRIEVKDECGGLQMPHPQELFRPFVQKENDRRGFGLGLGIVKQAAEAHHGNVHVEDSPGKGCVFVVELPRSQESEQEQEHEQSKEEPQR